MPNFVEIWPVFLQRTFEIYQCVFTQQQFSSIEGVVLHLNKFESPLPMTKDSLLFWRQNCNKNDDDGQRTNFNQKRSFQHSAQVSWKGRLDLSSSNMSATWSCKKDFDVLCSKHIKTARYCIKVYLDTIENVVLIGWHLIAKLPYKHLDTRDKKEERWRYEPGHVKILFERKNTLFKSDI